MSAKIVAIHRHPVKGFTAESLSKVQLVAGRGLPLDRHFAFVSGNREDQPQPGGWVQSRTFLMLTVYPELARFDCRLEDDNTLLVVSDPDGHDAAATVGQPETFGDADDLIRRHFEDGPHGTPRLVEQVPEYGHWDFSDTAISIINLATVRVISEAVGKPLEKERFRGNLYIDGLEPWEEFSWPGCRISVGGVELDILRPIKRCAMTSTEPGTGLRKVDVPAAMTKAFGHMFCGVYARVAATGRVASGDAINVVKRGVLGPHQNLPERAAEPALWPRFAKVECVGDRQLVLRPSDPAWKFPAAEVGQTVRFLATGFGDAMHRLAVLDASPDAYQVDATGVFFDQTPDVLMSGPFGRGS